MQLPPSLRRSSYRWIIVAASFLIIFFAFGIQQTFGVFLKPLQEELGWTRAMISWVPGLYSFLLCVFGFFAGWFTDRYGPKIIVGIGGFFMGLGLVLTSRITAPWQLYTYYSLMVSFGTGCAGIPVFTTISRWFVERRGLALGITASAMGLGIMIMPPLARHLISAYSWRTSYLVMGFAAWAIIIAALFLKKQPEETGAPPNEKGDPSKHRQTLGLEGLTVTQASRTSALRLLILLPILVSMGFGMVMTHLVAYAEGMRISEMTAATFLSAIGASSSVGRISMGIAADRLGRKPLYALCLILQATMMLWLIKATSVWMFYLFTAAWGFGNGGMQVIFLAITGDLFGLRHMGSILGLTSLGAGIGGVVGPPIAGHIFDATGSYSTAFLIAAVLIFLAAIMVSLLKAPKMD